MRAIRASLTAATVLALLLSLAALNGPVSAQPYPPPVGSLSTGASPTTPSVGGATTLTATVLDNSGNPVSGAEVSFQIATQPGTDARFANSLTQITAVTGANGVATAVLSAGNKSGNIVIKMVSGDKSSQLTLQVQPVAGVPATGGPPASEDGDGLAGWQAALIAAGVAILIGGSAVMIRRRL